MSETTYDEVSYPSHPFTQTHPDRLATLATLFGLRPAPIERCRVLELGCGDGANILPWRFFCRTVSLQASIWRRGPSPEGRQWWKP